MATQTIPPSLLKTWLDIYSSKQLLHLHPIVLHKMTTFFGSADNAEQYYINYLHQQNNIEWIKVA